MIDINNLQEYFLKDTIVISAHAKNRCRERGIKQKDIRNCIMTGEIIEQYPEDYPFPSCLVCGKSTDGRIIHVVISNEGEAGRIITAYIPSLDKFERDLKTRREHSL
ncbi:MAG: DUF4258 domain-containing protein [Clostridiales bacterium]|nr:DUF4258 domain-containing protein [Clostridiales bacterium]